MEPTQGPYTVEHGSKGEIYVVSETEQFFICEIRDTDNNAEANAALLAASWEMREALEAVIEELLAGDRLPIPSGVYRKARAALAKATQIT